MILGRCQEAETNLRNYLDTGGAGSVRELQVTIHQVDIGDNRNFTSHHGS